MNSSSPDSVETLVDQLSKLPTIGRKTARRLAAYILKMPREEVRQIAEAMVDVKDRVKECSICYNITDDDPCRICVGRNRDHSLICVVEDSNDVLALERTRGYRGVYHVLGGIISPLDGVGPDDLNIRSLVRRVAADHRRETDSSEPQVVVSEVILAMNPTVEGDTTSYYISQLLETFDVKVTRIARGIPIGGDLDYADEATLSRALEGRVAID